MNDNIESDVFEIIKNTEISYEKFEAIVRYVRASKYIALGKCNAEFYDHFSKLSNSINNAGWQDRHSEQIRYINEVQYKICEGWEEFLP